MTVTPSRQSLALFLPVCYAKADAGDGKPDFIDPDFE